MNPQTEDFLYSLLDARWFQQPPDGFTAPEDDPDLAAGYARVLSGLNPAQTKTVFDRLTERHTRRPRIAEVKNCREELYPAAAMPTSQPFDLKKHFGVGDADGAAGRARAREVMQQLRDLANRRGMPPYIKRAAAADGTARLDAEMAADATELTGEPHVGSFAGTFASREDLVP
jgi:hypothetical protein